MKLSKKLLSEYVHEMQDGFVILNESGEIEHSNHAFDKVLSESMQVGKRSKITDLFSDKESEMVAAMLTSAKVGEDSIYPLSCTRNGHVIHFQVSVRKVQASNGELDGWIMTFRDNSTLRNVESKLYLSDDILKQIGNLVVIADANGQVLYCAPSVNKILGYTPEDLLMDGWWQKTFETEEEAEEHRSKTERWASGLEPVPEKPQERKVITKNGRGVWILWQITVGPVGLVVSVGHDISGLKQTEMALRESEEKLKAKNRELDTFVYKASHDLKGPLASIMGLTNLAALESPDETENNYVALIAKSALRLDNILNDLLRVSRTTQGSFERTPVDLDKCIKDIIGSIEHTKGAKAVNISCKCDVTGMIVSNKELLTSIFQNLIDNAVKYRNYKVAESVVQIEAYEFIDGVCVEVIDNGIGIESGVQKKVFDMFYRGHQSSDGTGLGLYIVKTTVEKLGGRIKLKSERNKGSTFTVYLPCEKIKSSTEHKSKAKKSTYDTQKQA